MDELLPVVFSLYESGSVLLWQETLCLYEFGNNRPVGCSYMTQYNTHGFVRRVRFVLITKETWFNSRKKENNFHFYKTDSGTQSAPTQRSLEARFPKVKQLERAHWPPSIAEFWNVGNLNSTTPPFVTCTRTTLLFYFLTGGHVHLTCCI